MKAGKTAVAETKTISVTELITWKRELQGIVPFLDARIMLRVPPIEISREVSIKKRIHKLPWI